MAIIKSSSTIFDKLFIPEEEYEGLSFSSEEMEVIGRSISRLSIGSITTIPMRCSWDNCILAASCPFYKLGKKEIKGKNCLLELSIIKELLTGYLLEYEVSGEDITDRLLLQELVEKEILLMRINALISLDPSMTIEEVAGISPRGDAYYKKTIEPLLDLKLRIESEKRKIIKLMVGDRQEKYKKQAALREKSTTDVSSTAPDVKKQLEILQQEIHNKNKDSNDEVVSPDSLFPLKQ
jgi:hypothetical protein